MIIQNKLRIYNFFLIFLMNFGKYLPTITRKRFAISLVLGSSYFLYAEGRNRYRAIHYTNMYDSIPPTDVSHYL